MKTILEYLENSEKKHNSKVAVIDETGRYTYKELVENSKKIGSGILEKIDKGNPVPVLMEKGKETLSTFFGIVYAGCFYCLLNPSLPETRLKNIINTLNAKYIVTDQEHSELATKLVNKDYILLEEDLKNTDINQTKLNLIRQEILDVDPLYANFTSGSTGIPKGVVVGNRSVIDFIDNFTNIFNINENDIIGNQAPFDFDVSVKDIYSSISKGATLVIIPKRLFSLPVKLLDFICENKVTTLIWAVSALCLITTFHGLDYKTPKSVNKILFSGEVMPIKHIKQWIEHLPNAMFVNLYGPTEITCNCTYHIVDKSLNYVKSIPIGKHFPNEEVFLLNDKNELIKDTGKTGEICVKGTCLALGYYNNEEQTSKSFIQNPLNPNYIDIIYKTGDLGEYDENNDLHFLGRKDFQIKFMGHRIELEEIERAMEKIPEVERSCCIFNQEKEKLYGFYVGKIDKKQVHDYLKNNLPIFMIPNKISQIEKFELTKNGKIDRMALLKNIKK